MRQVPERRSVQNDPENLQSKIDENEESALKILAVLLLWLVPPMAQAEKPGSLGAVIRLDDSVSAGAFRCRSLTAIVGDSIAEEFRPQLELKAWEGECSFKIDLRMDQTASILSASGDTFNDAPRINCRQDSITAFSIYRLPSGDLEWEIQLASSPDSNVLTFAFEADGLLFYYQDTTLFESDIIHVGPEWAQGSYAVYHAARRNNRLHVNGSDTTGEIYSTGKVFHIRRPQALDSNGESVWCDINIDMKSSKLTISVPQHFLDRARYPVIIDPTFGKSSVGAWNLSIVNYRHIVLWNVGAAETGEGDITGGYVFCDVDGDLEGIIQVKVHSYTKGGDLDDSKLHSSSQTTDVTDSAGHWAKCSMSGILAPETTYMATVQAYNSVNNKLKIRGDMAPWGDVKYLNVGSWNVPDSLTGYYSLNEAYSVYVEYVTKEEGLLRRRRRMMQNNFGRNDLPDSSVLSGPYARMGDSAREHVL